MAMFATNLEVDVVDKASEMEQADFDGTSQWERGDMAVWRLHTELFDVFRAPSTRTLRPSGIQVDA